MTDRFTETQISEFKEAFDMFTRDGRRRDIFFFARQEQSTHTNIHITGDGTIASRDAGTVMRALGQNPTNKEVKYLIGQVGSLSGGTMEFGAFLRMMAAHMEEFTDDEGDAVAAFKAYDREQTGFMSVAELRHLTTKMGQEAVSEEDFDSMLAEVGIDPDGQVDYVAFVQAMCK